MGVWLGSHCPDLLKQVLGHGPRGLYLPPQLRKQLLKSPPETGQEGAWEAR